MQCLAQVPKCSPRAAAGAVRAQGPQLRAQSTREGEGCSNTPDTTDCSEKTGSVVLPVSPQQKELGKISANE